jgi:hypothetical protein
MLVAVPHHFHATPASAQPAPTFMAACDELSARIAAHGIDDDDYVVIDVVGEVTLAETDGVVAYLGMCEPPAPRVLCITYSLEGIQPGDRVILSGAYARPGPEAVRLDPCLHYPPEEN